MAANYRVLVLTVDTWQTGWRPGDLDYGYSPFAEGDGAATIFSDPVFRSLLAQPPEVAPQEAMSRWLPMFNRTRHSWESVTDLRKRWPGFLVVKGIQRVEDAIAAVDAGADGIVVSNHGGRHLDCAIGSLDVLPEIVDAVGGTTTVLFDSGIRGGADVVIALALGARAVLIGRPYVYGLAVAGEEGVEHVLSCIAAETLTTMGNSGYRTVEDLTRTMLKRRDSLLLEERASSVFGQAFDRASHQHLLAVLSWHNVEGGDAFGYGMHPSSSGGGCLRSAVQVTPLP